jgi:8-oxo-dGTP pyrophosphatase MutT (NUDIX family)
MTKSSEKGKIDHVCGSVISGETPEEAAIRESKEETGIDPNNVRIVDKGLNKYNRYRYLLVGKTDCLPGKFDPNEVEWVKFISLEKLRKDETSGEFKFVGEFFEDTEIAIRNFRK